MFNVFISYRRDDSAGYAGRLADSLDPLLGSGKIFRDVEDIHPGDDYVKAIEQNLQHATALFIVIGKNWLTAKDDQGLLRLINP
ncbi:toll/interleukin-1 receptor domain-containing protein [Methyloglobulus sp.]|uniref:toll/interleukin-1 receptor domain-containing protein n=1 Tax=Methyloglobulus sp. TaxID=2518622 RepID=UPI00398A3871